MWIALVALLPVQAQADDFWKALAGAVAPRVESPFLRDMGFHPAGANMVVTNGTPFWGRLVVYHKVVANLGPGDVAYDTRRWEPLQPQIPALVLLYRDPEMTDYLGAAGRIFSISGGYATSVAWNAQLSDFETPDGRYLQANYGVPVYPAPDAKLRTGKVKFPRGWWNSTAGNQLVNNTLFMMRVRVNGHEHGDIPPGSFYYLAAKQFFGFSGRRMTAQLLFTDRGRFVGAYDYAFDVPSDGIAVYQAIIGPHHIRR